MKLFNIFARKAATKTSTAQIIIADKVVDGRIKCTLKTDNNNFIGWGNSIKSAKAAAAIGLVKSMLSNVGVSFEASKASNIDGLNEELSRFNVYLSEVAGVITIKQSI